jgi:hypothetical protein
MERPINIFVEGIADEKFIQDYVSYILNIELSKNDIIKSEGWTNIISTEEKGELILNKMISNTDNGGLNLIIFDSDSDCENRRKEILKWGLDNSVEFQLFLFPNNSLPGTLEDLLENIINQNNKPIFDCWGGFEDCIQSKTIVGRSQPLTIPAKKTKIYGYLETLLGKSNSEKEKIKERERNYKEKSHWNLDSEFINPLREFLTENIK